MLPIMQDSIYRFMNRKIAEIKNSESKSVEFKVVQDNEEMIG